MFFSSNLITTHFVIPAKEFVKSWFGYRYGIFPEYGLEGDHLYPNTFVDGNETVPNLGCQGVGVNSTGNIFADLNIESNKINEFCPIKMTETNTYIISEPSLFCGHGSYNRRAPTKQNIFCSGSSALETVLNNKDFKVLSKLSHKYLNS